MTIQQLQAYVDSKPDIRELINTIVDYIQNNPGGGGGSVLANFYLEDSSLSSNRTVDLNGSRLNFQEGSVRMLTLQPANFYAEVKSQNSSNVSNLYTEADPSDFVGFYFHTTDAIANPVSIMGNGQTSSVIYTADTHTFNGKIINPDIIAKDFADDTAAEAGGVAVGEDYHTSGVKKVRIA